MDDFVEEDDIHQVLYAVLNQYWQSSSNSRNGVITKDDNGDSGRAPTATPDQKVILQELLDATAQETILAMTDQPTLEKVEQLIPDPKEDEDGFRSSWDTVLELHGREAVRINEEGGDLRWKALSIVSRVLIHYDFLLDGIAVPEDSPQ